MLQAHDFIGVMERFAAENRVNPNALKVRVCVHVSMFPCKVVLSGSFTWLREA
jgi:hypothetical protein